MLGAMVTNMETGYREPSLNSGHGYLLFYRAVLPLGKVWI